MKIAIALGGTDFGRSGIGVYVRAVVPAIAEVCRTHGDDLILIGTERDLAPIDGSVSTVKSILSPRWDAPATSAAFYLGGGADRRARKLGADVLLLPAANRRVSVARSLPTVAVVHDLGQLHVAKKYDGLRMAYARHALRAALPRASELVAISGVTRRDLAKFIGVSERSIRVVMNGVDRDRFAPLPPDGEAARRARAHFQLEGPYLVYVSRLEHPGKNHLRLVEAFASSPLASSTTLALAGGDWGAAEVIRARALELGVGARVKLLGFVPDDVLQGLYAGALSAIMVGLREGFGLPALEALSMGVPVVASSTGALPEVVGDLGVMCDPFDVASIRAAIERVATDETHRARIRVEGPKRAASRGWSETARGLHAACVDAVTRSTAARAA